MAKPKPRITCKTCNTTYELNWYCVACCLRWLSQMTPDEMRLNAPVIGIVAGAEHLQNVRQAYKSARGGVK